MTKQFSLKKTIDETQKEGAISRESEVKTIRNDPLARLSRQLSDKDLENRAVVRLILNLNDRLEEELQELKDYKEKYYESDKRVGILETQINSININFILIALGSISLGFVQSLWNKPKFFWPVLLVGITFLMIGFFKKPKFGSKHKTE